MSAYLIGNLLGRLIVSYLLVFGANVLIGRLDLRAAAKRTHRPWGLAAVLTVFLIGLLGRIVA